MSYENWLKIYNRNSAYNENLERSLREFLKVWEDIKPSPHISLEAEYTSVASLGAGAFGIVNLCKNKKTGLYLAIKVLEKSALVRQKQVDQVISEKRILAAVCFPFLVYLVCSAKDNSCLYLGLPYISGGELYKYHQKARRFPEGQAKFYAAQILLAIEYLHYLNILYRDLKTENILIDSYGYIKVSDFGFCKRIDSHTWTLCGTPEYLPPEIIKARPYGKSVDWWSFGILCYEFVAGYTPFRSSDTLVMYERICKGSFKVPASFSKELKILLSGLLQVDVTKRLGVLKNGSNDIKALEWFKDTNWKAILGQDIVPIYIPRLDSDFDTKYFDIQVNKFMPFSDENLYNEEFSEF